MSEKVLREEGSGQEASEEEKLREDIVRKPREDARIRRRIDGNYSTFARP